MAIAYESIQSATNDGSATITVTKPTGLAEGDLMVAFIGSGADTTGNSSASGWTLINGVDDATFWGSNPGNLTCLAKIATSGDVAASNFTFTKGAGNDETQAAILRFSATGSFNLGTLVVTSTGGTGLTPASDNTMLVSCVFEDTASSYSGWAIATNDPAWTEVLDNVYTVVLSSTMGIVYANRPEATATGAWSVTASGGGELLRINLAINEQTDVTVSATPLIVTGTIPNATATGHANVTATPLTATGTLPDATVTAQQNTVWTLDSKPSDASWANEDLIQ